MFSIQEARKEDLDEILEMVKELAEYENMLDELVCTKKDYEESFFKDNYAKALILREQGKAVGYAMYFYTFSSFLGRGGMYLEDLYIKKEFRKKGYAKAVFNYLANICKEKGLKRLEWVCLHDNELGINFYTRLNAENMSLKWRTYRLAGDTLSKLFS
ncbi:N-acetyltransferase [Campylobacter sp. MIT 12-8780]|uniref:GNAT family N-acetyltransferase n=1 Tax=unclassified Campylobacter TaxID=2593542 RepID=UPI0010F9BC27|nr:MULTISPECIES: GNAT family N-acetyltransferase [unclassified Campylobacter]TKX29392.1 N-acetyltransferase [Campylobacter sp. MIT 12-5580]TQR42985.1 N-acetyltransferase [Campylobacter sp. MIT 12-8780]